MLNLYFCMASSLDIPLFFSWAFHLAAASCFCILKNSLNSQWYYVWKQYKCYNYVDGFSWKVKSKLYELHGPRLGLGVVTVGALLEQTVAVFWHCFENNKKWIKLLKLWFENVFRNSNECAILFCLTKLFFEKWKLKWMSNVQFKLVVVGIELGVLLGVLAANLKK